MKFVPQIFNSVPNINTLHEIHFHLLTSLKYENLSQWYGPKGLRPNSPSFSFKWEDLAHKFSTDRGGICIELNGFYKGILLEVGYSVDLCSCRIVFGQSKNERDTHLALLVKCEDCPEQIYLCDIGNGDYLPNTPMLLQDGVIANGPAGRKVRLSKKTESGWVFEAFEKNDWKAFYEFDLVDGIKDEDYFQDMLDFVSIPSNNSFPLNGKFCCRVFPDLSQVIIYGDMAPNGEGISVVRLDGTGNVLEKSKVLMEKEFREVMIKLFEIDIYQIAI
jgi:arylamine N-acetyltransferase